MVHIYLDYLMFVIFYVLTPKIYLFSIKKIFCFQPPRIGGVKVYDRNVSRSEIIMDLDIL
jgi:hypothetical protein